MTATSEEADLTSAMAINALIDWKLIGVQLIAARFSLAHVRTTIVQVYASTEEADDATKDEFYDVLQSIIDEIPKHDLKIIFGD